MIEKFFNKLLGKRPTRTLFENIGNFSLLKEDNMKTVKIIDLFIEYTKPVKQPRKIKFKDKLYIYNGHAVLGQIIKDYGSNIIDLLNDEVEILEEPKKIPEKLNICYKNDDIIINEKILQEDLNTELADKINEILDYLESKGE